MNENNRIDREKAQQFVIRLMSNPALQGLAPLKKEQQIAYFLKVNEEQLLPTLCSPAFFPGMDRKQINALLIGVLREMTNQTILPPLKQFITGSLRPSALSCAVKDKDANINAMREALWKMTTSVLSSSEGRDGLIPAITLFASPLFNRYVPQFITRQKYISFEIRMVQRFKEIPENIVDILKLTVLLKPIVHTFLDNTGELINGCISLPYANQIVRQLHEKYPALPEILLQGIVHSNVSFAESRDLPATSRLGAIFTQRAINWNPDQKIDRGAESSDKSWFSIARKNYKYYGYDMDMLMELYNIAAEMGW
ncbi:MAG: hypothetical protein PQJ59_15445 [Spirochaetales bacterium]|nr:hypothetical protein [Spirochaetales bacterium]